jgi:hypothetical protein
VRCAFEMLFINRRRYVLMGHIIRNSNILCFAYHSQFPVIYSVYECFSSCVIRYNKLCIQIHSFCDNFTGVNDQEIMLPSISSIYSKKQMNVWHRLGELCRCAADARREILDIVWKEKGH